MSIDVRVGDVITFDAYHDGHKRHVVDDPVHGVVKVAGESTLRVQGIGVVDVDRDDVIDVVRRPEG